MGMGINDLVRVRHQVIYIKLYARRLHTLVHIIHEYKDILMSVVNFFIYVIYSCNILLENKQQKLII